MKKTKDLSKIRISNNDKLNFLSGLGTMLRAGLSVLEVVSSLAEDSRGDLKIFFEVLYEDLTQGKTISSSLAKFPRSFDKVTINVLKSAEESGTLESTLKDVETTIQKTIKFNDKIRSALLYPLVVSVVFIFIIVGILIFVIPRVSTVFTSLNIDLPLPTKILLYISNILTQQTIWVVGFFSALILGIIILYIKKRDWLINRFLSLPFISTIAAEIDLTRFSHSLSLLLDAGIPITSALALTQEVIVKEEIRNVIAETRDMVGSGKKISESFKKYKKIIPKLVIKIIEAGEHSGSLSASMQYISDYLEYQVEKKLFSATTLLEPFMLVTIGFVVGGMMLSIISPIYSLIGQIGPR